jgi:hypothetical protein
MASEVLPVSDSLFPSHWIRCTTTWLHVASSVFKKGRNRNVWAVPEMRPPTSVFAWSATGIAVYVFGSRLYCRSYALRWPADFATRRAVRGTEPGG